MTANGSGELLRAAVYHTPKNPFRQLKPPAGSPLGAVAAHAESAEGLLASIFTLAGAESARETWVGGSVVFRNDDPSRN